MARWTKYDLLVHLKAEDIKYQSQLAATFMFIKKTPHTEHILVKWANTISNFHLINDSPSFFPNDPTFKEHRHD
jgi:hypothetical protein